MSTHTHTTPKSPDAFAVDAGTAHWFDGLSSQPKTVRVVLQSAPCRSTKCSPTRRGPTLLLHDAQEKTSSESMPSTPAVPPLASFSHRQIGWPEQYHPRRPPARLVADLRDAGSLEILDPARWHAACQATGARASLARRMQTRWRTLLAVLALAVVVVAGFQRYGAPMLAVQGARWVPLEWELTLRDRALSELSEDGTLTPSRLPPARQAALRARFDALVAQIPPHLRRYPEHTPPFGLVFHRATGRMAVNAFALPGGAVVMTDGLVQLAAREGLSDDALAGVLAHELGHVMHRHHARRVIEHSVFGVVLTLATGDISGVWATASTIVSGFAYSRAHEREADCFAHALLLHANIPTEPLADFFMVMVKLQETSRRSTASSNVTRSAVSQLLQTHPDTLERATQFRQTTLAGHCKLM